MNRIFESADPDGNFNPSPGLSELVSCIRYVTGFDIGQALVVPSVYGVCYAAAGDKASTFAISDLSATAPAAGGTLEQKLPRAGISTDQVRYIVQA